MKRISHSILLLMLIAMMTSCVKEEAQQQDETSVVADVAFSVSKASKSVTRMSSAIVQEDGQPYRGIVIRHIIPFAVSGKIGVDDKPKAFEVNTTGEKPVAGRAYYYYENCSLMSGVCSFLSYGQSPASSVNKADNGSLVETFPADLAPKDIRFSLESITPQTVHPTARALANYMTAIATATANGTKWEDAPSGTLRVIFINFTNQIETTVGGEPLPGSAANIRTYAQELKKVLNQLSLTDETDIDIRTAIIKKIDDEYDTAWDGFPASIGLPDGAAVIRWTGTKFEAQTTTTTLADVNSIDRFAYPAELYYYGNSLICTSSVDKRKASYTDKDWEDVLSDYEYEDGVVSSNTTAIAIKEPLQYGVSHVKIKLLKTDASTLKAVDKNVDVGTNYFPLTGIIIGGQLPVGFDFTPATAYPSYSEADMKFIYDSQVKTNGTQNNEYFYLSSTADASQFINTLVLQSYDHKKVPVVLEFQNNSGTDFKSLTGTVLDGTKFYVVGQLDPKDFENDERTEIRDRVFTQDYTTVLNLKVKSLEKSYNVVPNLLSPRLEMGIELTPDWVQATTKDVIL